MKSAAFSTVPHFPRPGRKDSHQGARASGQRTDPELYAYSLDEVLEIIGELSGPAHIAVAIAAFTGMRESEIRGLQ